MSSSVRISPEEVRDYFKSLKAVTDALDYITFQDAYDIALAGTEELKRWFPESTPATGRYYEKGAKDESTNRLHLRSGWRTYPTTLEGSPGYVIQHVRFNDSRVRTILAALDQGSQGHWIYLRHAKAFRFPGKTGEGDAAIVNGTEGEEGRMWIPRRDPQPYIVPTQNFITNALTDLSVQRAKDIEVAYVNRGKLLRSRYAALQAKK